MILFFCQLKKWKKTTFFNWSKTVFWRVKKCYQPIKKTFLSKTLYFIFFGCNFMISDVFDWSQKSFLTSQKVFFFLIGQNCFLMSPTTKFPKEKNNFFVERPKKMFLSLRRKTRRSFWRGSYYYSIKPDLLFTLHSFCSMKTKIIED